MHLKVPSIACEGCAEIIAKAIAAIDADASVIVNVSEKTVEIETQRSSTEVKNAIVSAGHTVEA